MEDLRNRLGALGGSNVQGLEIIAADDFAYTDPVDGSTSQQQGIRINFSGGARVVLRLSGTGTQGATLRVYLEDIETDPARLGLDPTDVLAPIAAAVDEIAQITKRTGRDAPDLKT